MSSISIKSLKLVVAVLFLITAGCQQGSEGSADKVCERKSEISVEGMDMPADGQFGHIAFKITAAWMDGHLEMRTPETVRSQLGLHFIDHDRADLPPLTMPDKYPKWHKDQADGAIWYNYKTEEGIEFSGRAWVSGDVVEMKFTIKNNSDKAINHVTSQQCLVMTPSADFGRKNTLDTTYAWVDGKFTCLNTTTPTPIEKGRQPWILMRTKGTADSYKTGDENPDGWWVVNEIADEYIIARASEDGRHLLAISWDEQPVHTIMSNATIPCLHAGPMSSANIEAGAEYVWTGRIFLMASDPDKLLSAYRAKAN